MGVFFVLLLVPMAIQHFTMKGSRIDYGKKNKWALAFFFLGFTLLVMLRHKSVGTDTGNYVYFFEQFSQMSWHDVGQNIFSLEVGFSYFNKAVSLFSKDPQFFLAVTAIVISVMIYPTYKRLCVDTALTVVLFCTMSTFVMMFSGIRQGLAIGIGFIAYEFTRNKKIIPFILSVLLAITAHTSAFMLLLMYPIYHIRMTKKWLIAVVPALTVIFVFNRQIFSFFGTFLDRFTKYDANITQTGAYAMVFLFAIFTVFSFLVPEESLLDKETMGLRNFLLLALVIQMFAPLHALAMRMNYYYIIFIPLLLPKVIQCRSERWRHIAVMGRHVMVVFFLIYFFFGAYRGGNLNVFPYHFFWEVV